MTKLKYPTTLIISIVIAWFISLVCVLQFKIVLLAEDDNSNSIIPTNPHSSAFAPPKDDLNPHPPVTDDALISQKQSIHAPFNPFTDIQLSSSQNTENKAPPYSSFHCVQADQSGYPDYTARTCEYRNLYYKPSDQSFRYHARPHELKEYDGNTTTLGEAMTVADGFLRWDKLQMGLERVSVQGSNLTYEWKPEISTDFATCKYAIISSPVNPVFVLYLPSYSFNLGHLVFDDLLSIFAMLHMFGYANEQHPQRHQPIPFFVERPSEALGLHFGSRDPFWRCHPDHADRWSKCIQLWRRIYPSLLGVTPDPRSGDILRTGNWLRGIAAIGEFQTSKLAKLKVGRTTEGNMREDNALPPGPDHVLLPTVIYGPGRLANWACKGECAIGRGLWLWEFRRYLIGNIYGPNTLEATREPPNQGYVTISLPAGSTHLDKVTFFEDVIEAAKFRFGADGIKVVDMAKLSLKRQARLVRESAVYLTNHGGGSASALLLPRGATLIIYHGIGKQKEPKMLDRHLWNSLGYARVLWVHPVDHHNVEKSLNLIQYGLETFSR
jgi:hypothetical protein